jgi:hypothetical protein
LLRRFAFAIALTILPIGAQAGWLDDFRDPEDGQFDATNYLLERKGALPVPILITEPAVGYGGGAALVFFQQSLSERAAQGSGRLRYRPPNMYGAAGFGTENGSWGAGGGAMISFAEDRWRFRGGGLYCDLNLDFYGIGSESDRALGYSLSGAGGMGMLLYRLGNTDAWLAARALYLSLENEFDVDATAPFADEDATAAPASDHRSNMTPATTSSLRIAAGAAHSKPCSTIPPLGATPHSKPIERESSRICRSRHALFWERGSTRGRRVRTRPSTWCPISFCGGFRPRAIKANAPPLSKQRARWNATRRWALMGFFGAGRAWRSDASFSDVDSHGAGGTGFRYLVARQLGVHGGLDFAWGPDFALYIVLGNAWR